MRHPGLTMDGRSLIPVVRNPGIEQGRELLIESERWYQQPAFNAIHTRRYVYAEYATGEKELYDLQSDPFELFSRDQAPAYASIRSTLATRLHQLQNCAGSSCRTRP